MIRCLLGLIALALLQGSPEPAPVVRPRDPWVFRSVLDGRPRIVTIALDDEMWVAYDATTCGLYKAWKGGVRFEGAVYTTEHGPQPVSFGRTYTEGYPAPTWEAATVEGRKTARAVWRGYRVVGTRHVTLLYDIVLEDGRTVRVEETPEFARPMDRYNEEQIEQMGIAPDVPGLLRIVRVVDPPEGLKLTVPVRTDGVLAKHTLAMERETITDIPGEAGEEWTRIDSHLVLGGQLALNYVLLLFEPLPAVEPEAEPERGSVGDPAPDARGGAEEKAQEPPR